MKLSHRGRLGTVGLFTRLNSPPYDKTTAFLLRRQATILEEYAYAVYYTWAVAPGVLLDIVSVRTAQRRGTAGVFSS